MTKARDFADIAGAVSACKIASDDVNVSFENITDTGNTGLTLPKGTTLFRRFSVFSLASGKVIAYRG